MTNYRDWVKEQRERRGWGQLELAVKSGLTVRTISNIENGKKPESRTIASISCAFRDSTPVIPDDVVLNSSPVRSTSSSHTEVA